MHLLLITGFLGSGKTTLVIKLAQFAAESGKTVAILVNEIGEVGIDNQLMRQLSLNVWALLNGCICCTLTTDLVTTLQLLDTDYSPDFIIIEPSGAALPDSILNALSFYRGTPFDSLHNVSILDPLRLEILLEVLTPLITAHIRCADTVIVSKSDLATLEQMDFAHRVIDDCNPAANVLDVGSDTPADLVFRELSLWLR
jgi:G3E family GTPase